MTQTRNDIILSGVHLDLTDALKQAVYDKVDKLFRHEQDIIRVRVELMYTSNRSRDKEFEAKGIIEIHGPDIVVSAASEDLYKSIDQLVIKLDRKLRRRSRLRKVKRNHPHEVDLAADLPKVNAA